LLQEFDLEIKAKKGCENNLVDHLSRLSYEVTTLEPEVLDEFLDEKLLAIEERPWFAYMTNFKAFGVVSENFDWHQRIIFLKMIIIMYDEPHLLKIGADNLLRRCVAKDEANKIIWKCHSSLYGGHFNGE